MLDFSQTISISVFLLLAHGNAPNVLEYVTSEQAITAPPFGREVLNISACLMDACLRGADDIDRSCSR